MGAAHERAAATRLLRQRVAGRDGCRLPRRLRRLFWYDRRTGLCVRRWRRPLGAYCPGSSGCAVGGSADPAMIRIVLPGHLRTLAQVEGEVAIEVKGPATQRAVLDALEARYPMLRGTTRDHITQQRRPF